MWNCVMLLGLYDLSFEFLGNVFKKNKDKTALETDRNRN